MVNDSINTASILSVAPQPQKASAFTADNAAQNTVNTPSQANDASQSADTNATQTSDSSKNTSSFSTLLSSKPSAPTPAQPGAKTISKQPATKNAADMASAAASVTPPQTIPAKPVILAASIEAAAVTGSALQNADTNASAASGAAAPASAATLIAQLQALLQQLTGGNASASAQSGSVASVTPAQSAADLVNAIAAQAGAPASTTSTPATATDANGTPANSNAALAKAITSLLALLQQSGAAATSQQAAVTASSDSAASASITAAPSGPSLTSLLQQLSQALNQAPGTAPATDADAATTDVTVALAAGSAVKAAPATVKAQPSFASLLTATAPDSSTNNAQSTPAPTATSALQDAISQVVQLLNASHGAKTGSDADSSAPVSGVSHSQADASQQALPAPVQPTQPPSVAPGASGFVKLLSDAAPAQSASDQVLVQIKAAAAQGVSEMKIQLSPDDLGKVMVQLTTGMDGKTGITITADNRQTLALLQNEARSLQSALRDIGLKTDTGGLNFNLSGQQQNGQNNGKQTGSYTQVAAVSDIDDIDPITLSVSSYRVTAQDGLDIRV